MKDALRRLRKATRELESARQKAADLIEHRHEPVTSRGRAKGRRMDVTRSEFNRLVQVLAARDELLTALRRDIDIQFTRIAQLQATVDRLSTELTRNRDIPTRVKP
jgi:hypothetical protein